MGKWLVAYRHLLEHPIGVARAPLVLVAGRPRDEMRSMPSSRVLPLHLLSLPNEHGVGCLVLHEIGVCPGTSTGCEAIGNCARNVRSCFYFFKKKTPATVCIWYRSKAEQRSSTGQQRRSPWSVRLLAADAGDWRAGGAVGTRLLWMQPHPLSRGPT